MASSRAVTGRKASAGGTTTPRAAEPEHETADRRQRVAVDVADIDCAAGQAPWTMHIQPRHTGDDLRKQRSLSLPRAKELPYRVYKL